MNIGERIRDCRKKAGLSQKELGEKLNVSQQHIAQYESGKRTPKLDTIQKIATALQVDIKTLLENDYLETSPIYRAYKRMGDTGSELFLEHKKNLLTKDIDLEPIDIEVIKKFKTLNEKGKTIAIERIEELTEIPRYTKNEKKFPDKEE